MLKMYRPGTLVGSESEFWEANWESGAETTLSVQEIARVCENQGAVCRLLDERLRKERLFLEGGCGPGTWVRYYHQRGYRVLGIDFAERTLQRLRRIAPQVDVRLGDVSRLPLADGEVHTYLSNGVVEHFEDGPEPALAEARRVLAPDGWFLCSVPDASSLRDRILFRRDYTRLPSWAPTIEVRRVAATERQPPPPGTGFFQYLFSKEEFTRLLERSGFVVERTFGFSLIWGLMEIPGLSAAWTGAVRVARGLKRLRSLPEVFHSPSGGESQAGVPVARNRDDMMRNGIALSLERLVFQEDTSIPFLGAPLRLALEHCANMRMYVARPR